MVFRDYRGKSRSGHWVYGSLMFNDGFCTIFTNKNLSTDVIINTVGQWSGIYDINNTKVYEGVPWLDSNGVACMKDLVSGQLQYNCSPDPKPFLYSA